MPQKTSTEPTKMSNGVMVWRKGVDRRNIQIETKMLTASEGVAQFISGVQDFHHMCFRNTECGISFDPFHLIFHNSDALDSFHH